MCWILLRQSSRWAVRWVLVLLLISIITMLLQMLVSITLLSINYNKLQKTTLYFTFWLYYVCAAFTSTNAQFKWIKQNYNNHFQLSPFSEVVVVVFFYHRCPSLPVILNKNTFTNIQTFKHFFIRVLCWKKKTTTCKVETDALKNKAVVHHFYERHWCKL